MKTTPYFENSVRKRRSYLKEEWIDFVIAHPEITETQDDGRIRRWAFIKELGKYLRVITLDDGESVLNAFPDRDYKKKKI
jgi:hypothetical protein